MTLQHKCQLKQLGSGSLKFTENNIEGLTEWPHNWADGEISYRLNNHTMDIDKEKHQHRAVTVSLRAWQLRINKLKFRRERNPNVSVDFDVSFQPLSEFSSKGVLAHAYFPGQSTKLSGDVEINDEWNWTYSSKFQTLSKPPLVPILIHEFGHSLGLTHDTVDKASIMYPSFNLGEKKNTLGLRDIQRIQERYGQRNLSRRILDYFRRRRDMAWDFN